MQTWELQNNFGLLNLKQTSHNIDDLKENEVLVEITSRSLNFRDLLVIKGLYNPKLKLPLIPLSDCSGMVISVGKNVKDFQINDRVCGTFFQGEISPKNTLGSPLPGVLCQKRVFPSLGLIKFPPHLTYEEASTLPCAALTAYNALFNHGRISSRDTVLIQGTGGVSLFALQFAHAVGAKTIVTSSCNEKLKVCKKLGATETINYKNHPNWHEMVLETTNKKGVDITIEVAGASINQSILCTRPGGVIALIGILAGAEAQIPLTPILMKGLCIQGVFVGDKETFIQMCSFIKAHQIKPYICKTFSFDEAVDALTYMETQKHMGKICIK